MRASIFLNIMAVHLNVRNKRIRINQPGALDLQRKSIRLSKGASFRRDELDAWLLVGCGH